MQDDRRHIGEPGAFLGALGLGDAKPGQLGRLHVRQPRRVCFLPVVQAVVPHHAGAPERLPAHGAGRGERDHVHLLVHYPPKVAVSKLVNSLKGVSARRIRQEFTGRINRAIMHGHLWSPSYFSASCGGAPLAIVRQYIEQQKHPL